MTEPSMDDEPTVLWVVPTPGGLSECWALDAYSRPMQGLTRAAELFTKAKYQSLGPPLMVLKRMFAEGVSSIARFRRWPSDIAVVPVGSSSELPSELAQAAAVSLGVPLLEVFRPPSGPKVKNLPLGSRDRHAADRVVLDAGSACAPNVVLIDDLVESGSTLSAAAKALRGIGAHNVVAMVAVHIHH